MHALIGARAATACANKHVAHAVLMHDNRHTTCSVHAGSSAGQRSMHVQSPDMCVVASAESNRKGAGVSRPGRPRPAPSMHGGAVGVARGTRERGRSAHVHVSKGKGEAGWGRQEGEQRRGYNTCMHAAVTENALPSSLLLDESTWVS